MSHQPNAKVCLCLDSSVLLADTLKNQDARTRLGNIDIHQKKLNLDVYLPPTVKTECTNRIDHILSFVSDTLRNFESEFRIMKNDGSGELKDITLDDLIFIQEFIKKNISAYNKPASEYELLQRMEVLLVTYLEEKLENQRSMKYYDFVIGISVDINKIATSLRYDFITKTQNYKVITAIVDIGLLKKLQSESALQKTATKKPNDLQIICEIEAHQKTIKKWGILATLDKNDFLNNSDVIEKIANVICSDPLYLSQTIKRVEVMPTPW